MVDLEFASGMEVDQRDTHSNTFNPLWLMDSQAIPPPTHPPKDWELLRKYNENFKKY